MNPIDIVIVILLILSTLNGLRQGLINALANLIGWFLAFILAMRFTDQVQPLMIKVSTDPMLQKIAAFAAIVVVVILLTWLAGYIVQTMFKHLKLSWLNRLAGGAFGVAKSLFVFLILIHLLGPWFSGSSTWKTSEAIKFLQPYAAETTEYSREFVQKTTQEFEQLQSDENNSSQDDIIQPSTTESRAQVENPFL